MQQTLTRLYFLSKGCKQCPIELTLKPLWANGQEGFFLSAAGAKQTPAYSPTNRKVGRKENNRKRGRTHPNMRHFGNVTAHRLMAATYADEPCPIFFGSNGNPYKGLVHHVIENPYDIRVDNLIWWLTYREHHIADKRRRALEQVLPDMYAEPTAYLKRLQDPRKTSAETFIYELSKLADKYGKQDVLANMRRSF